VLAFRRVKLRSVTNIKIIKHYCSNFSHAISDKIPKKNVELKLEYFYLRLKIKVSSKNHTDFITKNPLI